MNKLKNRNGVTMAEILLVIAIIAVLAGIGLVGYNSHRRSLGQLERDGIAKEIFVAAQNHLAILQGEGYLGLPEGTAFGYEDTSTKDDLDADVQGDYYFVVNGSLPLDTVLGQMLPFGAIEETVRLSGSYIVRYQRNTGLVLDVFYCTRTGAPEQYNHTLSASDYTEVMALRDTDAVSHKSDRRDWDGRILGWYGGTEAAELPRTSLEAPQIQVVNAEKLYVEIQNTNSLKAEAQLRLIVTGVDSGAQKAFEIKATPSLEDSKYIINNTKEPSITTVILDDVTTGGMHFANLTADTAAQFIPGENLEIQAVAYSTTVLANVAYSPLVTTNSLFAAIDDAQTTAYIGNMRHLENLDASISNLDANDGSHKLNIALAEQTDSFSWIEFRKNVCAIDAVSRTGLRSEAGYQTVRVYNFAGSATSEGCYLPISPGYPLAYDGKHHSIYNVKVDGVDCGGLFGVTTQVSAVRNLELIDFSIRANQSAGALAGLFKDCTVTNVLARNTSASAAVNVTAPVAGGLIGALNDGAARYSAAALIVQGANAAGGLIGSLNGTVQGCYSGGHTLNGSYEKWIKDYRYDVTGSVAGGLVGVASGTIRDSYSTCSVSGSSMAGGLAGQVTTGTVTTSYAAGLIDQQQTGAVKFAFIGDPGEASIQDCAYYREVNQIVNQSTQGGEPTPMLPLSGYVLNAANMNAVKPLDLNADTYNQFTGPYEDWNQARAYDAALVQYYNGRYCLRTVDELDPAIPEGYTAWSQLYVITHYADWPSPEVFFINP